MSALYWNDDRLSGGETPTAFGGNNSGTGVGGSMLHWGAFVPRADPRDLKLKTDSGQGVDFPLTYKTSSRSTRKSSSSSASPAPPHYPWDPAAVTTRCGPSPAQRPGPSPCRRASPPSASRPPPPPSPPSPKPSPNPATADPRPPASAAASATRAASTAPRPAWTSPTSPRAVAAGAEIRAEQLRPRLRARHARPHHRRHSTSWRCPKAGHSPALQSRLPLRRSR